MQWSDRSQQLRMPKSQILFKTHFTNNTDREQDYSLRAERSTVTTFNFTFMKGFTKEKEGAVTFKLPNEVVEVGGGIKHEQRVDYGKDTTFETRMTWSADSNIRVAPHSRANAELIITEEEYSADFQVEVRFSGRISASICSRRDNNAYVKFVEGDMAAIFQDAIKTSNASQFEIFDNSIVRTIMSGKCAFRYGVEQHVTVEQDRLTSASEPPPRYHAIITNSH
ncbi:unnamed protein product [Didymodactylos carnosus]|uniref:Uncharacterized protein n=1 Tax=Didymodactylos carnosus TaxID=1234261 RepID=A0A8S2EJY4_9BILA|nr:unnamed protein product [Didymodactylos carnosus]CAF4035556.1 unnamed protein product [Didymodactylos carnosus]